MNILSLCSGVGGLELGLKLAITNTKVVCYVEIDPYCRRVLATRMRDGFLDKAPVWDDLRTFDGLPWRGRVDCIASGFPCQPFSLAGRRRGATDSRNLWPDVRRVIGEARPRTVFLENVPAILPYYYLEIRPGLSAMGYRVAEGIFSAAEVGAPHRRERLFILAHARCGGENGLQYESRASGSAPTSGTGSEDGAGWWEAEPCILRVVDGLAHRVDRLAALGNGVVSAVAAKAWTTLNGRLEGKGP